MLNRSYYRFALGVVFAGLIPVVASAEIVNRIIATVDGEPITTYELKQYRDGLRGRQLPPETTTSGTLDALITDKVVEREASQKGIIVRDEDIDRSIESVKERNHITEEQLKQALAQQGVTLEDYRVQLREDLVRQQLITRELRSKVTITPEDVQRYYEAHKEKFGVTGGRVHIAHVVLQLPEDASSDRVAAITAKTEELRDRLQKGEDFAELAQKVSEDKSAAQGGDLGWFKKGELLDAMESAVAKLKEGEVSPPVRTRLGLHLIKVIAREEAGQDAVATHSEEIKNQLYAEALETRFQKLMTEELRQRHDVQLK